MHRLLSSLAAEGLLDQDPGSGNWVLGPEILLLGSVASARFPLEDIARPSLRRLAEETGESAFFSIRRGNETVCLLREEGSFPVRSFVLHEGVRFPLGVASAGTAIMAFLPAHEQEELLRQLGSPRRQLCGRAHRSTGTGEPGSDAAGAAIRSIRGWSWKAAGGWVRRSSTSGAAPPGRCP